MSPAGAKVTSHPGLSQGIVTQLEAIHTSQQMSHFRDVRRRTRRQPPPQDSPKGKGSGKKGGSTENGQTESTGTDEAPAPHPALSKPYAHTSHKERNECIDMYRSLREATLRGGMPEEYIDEQLRLLKASYDNSFKAQQQALQKIQAEANKLRPDIKAKKEAIASLEKSQCEISLKLADVKTTVCTLQHDLQAKVEEMDKLNRAPHSRSYQDTTLRA